MMALARRLQALTLFLLFLGGGRSLSGADVAFFHLDGKGAHADAHFESAEGCASHAGHCGLGIPAGASTALTASPATPTVRFDISTGSILSPDGRPQPSPRRAGFNPRAPPVPTIRVIS